MSNKTARKDLAGMKFGRLKVERIIEYRKNGEPKWLCHCDCGNSKVIGHYSLLHGSTKSCGCLQKEKVSSVRKTHGMSGTRLHKIWKGMRRRCNNINDSKYERYGGRGITICSEWNDFASFYNWAINHGYEESLTIDRIDVNGNYCPDNCRWVDSKVQANNKTTNKIVEYNGDIGTLSEICAKYNFCYPTINSRVNRGWPDEYLFAPSDFKYKQMEKEKNKLVKYKNKKIPIVEAAKLSGLDVSVIQNRIKKGWAEEYLFSPKGFRYFDNVAERKTSVKYNGEEMIISKAAKASGLSVATIWHRVERGWPEEFLFKPNGFSYKKYMDQQEATAS